MFQFRDSDLQYFGSANPVAPIAPITSSNAGNAPRMVPSVPTPRANPVMSGNGGVSHLSVSNPSASVPTPRANPVLGTHPIFSLGGHRISAPVVHPSVPRYTRAPVSFGAPISGATGGIHLRSSVPGMRGIAI